MCICVEFLKDFARVAINSVLSSLIGMRKNIKAVILMSELSFWNNTEYNYYPQSLHR